MFVRICYLADLKGLMNEYKDRSGYTVLTLMGFCGFFSMWSFVFSSSPQRPTTSDFEGFLYQILSITFFLILFLEKEPVFTYRGGGFIDSEANVRLTDGLRQMLD